MAMTPTGTASWLLGAKGPHKGSARGPVAERSPGPQGVGLTERPAQAWRSGRELPGSGWRKGPCS